MKHVFPRWLPGRTWLFFVGILCALLVLSGAGMTTRLAAHAASARPYVTAPGSTTSHYESTTNATTLQNQGCSAAKGPTGVVVLDFGEPQNLGGGVYGTYDFGDVTISDSDILHAAANFALGVWDCRTSSKITIAIGTSNYGGSVSTGAGVAWGNMVASVESYITNNGYTSVLGADGAIDAETEWNSYSTTSNFVNGYNSVNNGRWLWDYGDDTPGYWTDQQVWYISYGAGDERPLPEIYYNADATQDWAAVAQWACANGHSMFFKGAMAEAVSGTNSPAQAYDDMYNALGTNSCTQNDRGAMAYATDI